MGSLIPVHTGDGAVAEHGVAYPLSDGKCHVAFLFRHVLPAVTDIFPGFFDQFRPGLFRVVEQMRIDIQNKAGRILG